MKRKLLTFLISITLLSGFILPTLTYAVNGASGSEVCQGVGEVSNQGSCDSLNASKSSLDGVLALVLNLLSAIVGLLAVIFIILSGMRYVTSAGNPEGTNNAKNTILYAVVGLIIVALAQIIVKFVMHKGTLL